MKNVAEAFRLVLMTTTIVTVLAACSGGLNEDPRDFFSSGELQGLKEQIQCHFPGRDILYADNVRNEDLFGRYAPDAFYPVLAGEQISLFSNGTFRIEYLSDIRLPPASERLIGFWQATNGIVQLARKPRAVSRTSPDHYGSYLWMSIASSRNTGTATSEIDGPRLISLERHAQFWKSIAHASTIEEATQTLRQYTLKKAASEKGSNLGSIGVTIDKPDDDGPE